MRLFAICVLVLLCAACGQSPETAPTSSSTGSVEINPARIDRVRGLLPDAYEVAGYIGPPTPITMWGFGNAAVSEPPQCLALAAPARDSATTRGWSASGPGGIVYAVVARSSQLPPGAAMFAECAQWTLTSVHTVGTVTAQPGPVVEAAATVAMSTTAATVVEGGTETRLRADTFVAYLVDYVCFVALVTDPGSPSPTLEAGFAADLLTAAVSALRG
ncbi:hypothetical protein NGTWS0302_15330 [Mycolicibacterium cyprinidarum]|uniref:DUF5642 domain-containing protein n=1 Tax=Mycolicibacterium cyprinidarum TaxID=2860311 RepID=A0ABQ4V6X2_9MYCO|nr:hypothetical protein NGTWS1702_37370 [Mycolicibacterium sp. NGTWSNA01]GJF17920.1 hypothetical protein NGTWS0302_15330 [Mycolicibacterium sp. NGTWS0302]